MPSRKSRSERQYRNGGRRDGLYEGRERWLKRHSYGSPASIGARKSRHRRISGRPGFGPASRAYARKKYASFSLLSRHIGYFRAWKDHDDNQKAFARVLRDLRVETPDAATG
jgi:hypothetical protein